MAKGEDAIYATRQDSPLVLGFGDDATYLASDVPAFIEYTNRVAFMEDGEFARVTDTAVEITDVNGALMDKRAHDCRLGSRGCRQERVRPLHAQGDP